MLQPVMFSYPPIGMKKKKKKKKSMGQCCPPAIVISIVSVEALERIDINDQVIIVHESFFESLLKYDLSAPLQDPNSPVVVVPFMSIME
jgi:hypothetical protein